MRSTKDADEKFEWDLTAVVLLVLLIAFVLVAVMAFGPFGHTK